jgi:hypothetical protein
MTEEIDSVDNARPVPRPPVAHQVSVARVVSVAGTPLLATGTQQLHQLADG